MSILELDPALGAKLRKSFPPSVLVAVDQAISEIQPPLTAMTEAFDVVVDGIALEIPYRVYDKQSTLRVHPAATWLPRMDTGDADTNVVIACLLSRHDNGFVRMAAAKRLLEVAPAAYPWTIPFVLRLLSEYVIETVQAIAEGLGELHDPDSTASATYQRFSRENPEFMRLTEARIASYWAEYFRADYLWLKDCPSYITFKLIGPDSDTARKGSTT